MAARRKTVHTGTTLSDAVQSDKKKEESRFLKEQLYASARYSDRKDLVEALLENGRGYTIKEVDNIIAGYLHGRKGKER